LETLNFKSSDNQIWLIRKKLEYILRIFLIQNNLVLDRLRIIQVIINIISNAIKNTPPKGLVFIRLSENQTHLEICVNDTGIGIIYDEKPRLFQKFGKIERYGMGLNLDIEGAGLGLYISKEIIELHGGQILVESKGRNKGTEFKIKLLKK